MRREELLAIEILRTVRLSCEASSMAGLAAHLGIEVFAAHVQDVRVSGRRVHISATATGDRRERLIAEGIAHSELDRRGDIQLSAHAVADFLQSRLMTAVGVASTRVAPLAAAHTG
jgi:hypothetical protein